MWTPPLGKSVCCVPDCKIPVVAWRRRPVVRRSLLGPKASLAGITRSSVCVRQHDLTDNSHTACILPSTQGRSPLAFYRPPPCLHPLQSIEIRSAALPIIPTWTARTWTVGSLFHQHRPLAEEEVKTTKQCSQRSWSLLVRHASYNQLIGKGTVLIDCFQDGTGVREELGGGGLYAVIGARIWLPASRLGIGIDRGKDDFPDKFDGQLEHFEGPCEHRERSHGMWYFHKGTNRQTLKARIGYDGDARRLVTRLRSSPQLRVPFTASPSHITRDSIDASR